MNTITILQPTQVTWQEYKDLRLEALRLEPQAFGSSYEDQKNTPDADWQAWLGRYRQADGNWMLFAKENDKLIGMIGAYQTEDNKKNHFAIIIAAYVSQNARGKGIAKLLMEHLLAQLIATTSIKTFTLSVNPTQVAAIKLYESFGFILIKKEPTTFGDGIRRETYFMQKTIS